MFKFKCTNLWFFLKTFLKCCHAHESRSFQSDYCIYSQENEKKWVKIKTLSKMHFMTLFFKRFKIKLMKINKKIYNLFSFMGRRAGLFTLWYKDNIHFISCPPGVVSGHLTNNKLNPNHLYDQFLIRGKEFQ